MAIFQYLPDEEGYRKIKYKYVYRVIGRASAEVSKRRLRHHRHCFALHSKGLWLHGTHPPTTSFHLQQMRIYNTSGATAKHYSFNT